MLVARSHMVSPGLEVFGRIASKVPFSTALKAARLRRAYHRNPDAGAMGNFRRQRTIFVRIPKNASTSLCATLYAPQPDAGWPGHASAEYYRTIDPDLFSSCLVFAPMRNPYDRLVSAFNYYKFKTKIPEERRLMDVELAHIDSFEDFLKYLEGFDHLEDAKIMRWHHFRAQTDFITSLAGEVIVDLLFPVEDMAKGLAVLTRHIGELSDVPELNKSIPGAAAPDWPPALQDRYRGDLDLWTRVMEDRLLFPTSKAQSLGLLGEGR